MQQAGKNFGFKVLNKPSPFLESVVEQAIAVGRPIEIGLYTGDPARDESLARRLAASSIPVNAHTNHERLHAFNLHQTAGLLEEHIKKARTFGSVYSVLHAGLLPMTQRPGRRAELLRHLLDNLERAEEICTALDYRLHLENVHDPLWFYRDLFEGIAGRGLSRIHFCFDIGHAKIWSVDSLDDWMAFIGELGEAGFRLHCHLHANRGLEDEHLAMVEAEALGITAPDDDYNPYGYPGAYWQLEERFPDAIKVFEVKGEQAVANLETVLAWRR